MRIFLTLLGTLALFMAAVSVMFIGILGFTPTTSCSGACTIPLLMSLIAPGVIVLSSLFATFFRARGKPRAYWPWLGAALIIGSYLVSLVIAEQVL